MHMAIAGLARPLGCFFQLFEYRGEASGQLALYRCIPVTQSFSNAHQQSAAADNKQNSR